jgi:hypothetical protein
MNEPTTTEAPTTNNAPAVDQASPTMVVDGQVADSQQAQQTTTDAVKTEAVKADAPKGAPEKYEFKAPEGRNFDNEVITSFSDIAKELNLSQESAQKILDKVGAKAAERQAQNLEAIRQEWAQTSQADKEFGGDNIQSNLAVAKKALDTFGTPELRSLLNESGLGNHPELIRFFYRAGKAISEDQYVVTNGSSAANKPAVRDFASAAATLYSNNNS